MKKNYFLTLLFLFSISLGSFAQDLIITGVIDGPLSGGTPKALELYAVNNIPDLSIYGVESVTNGNPSGDSPEYTFPADQVNAGTFIYLESVSNNNATAFNDFFGFNSTYQNGVLSVNGDDPIKLYMNGTAIDVFGSVGTDGSGETWEYLDGWAYRKSGRTATTTFSDTDWTYSSPNALDGESTNATAASPFPAGTYSTVASTVPTLAITAPTNNQVFTSDVEKIDIVFSIENFKLSADSGGGVSDNSNDGYIKVSTTKNGQPDGSTRNIFTVTPGEFDLENGSSYTLTAELVDNSGNSLNPKVEATVAFSSIFPCDIQLSTIATTCDAATTGTDTYQTTITFEGGNTGTTYTITAKDDNDNDVGTIGGDNPSNTAAGNIMITGVPEGTDFTVKVIGGQDSSCDLTRNINSPTCFPAPTCPAQGAVIITEIMQNPSAVSDSNGEYFEIYNTTNSSIDIQGWTIKTASTGNPVEHVIATSLVLPANGYLVLGENADVSTNGGVTVDYQYDSSLFLGNSTATVTIECSETVFDAVTYDNGATFPDPNGKSMELSTNKYTHTDNDMGENWGEATLEITIGGDLGTPGSINNFVLSLFDNTIDGFALYPNPVNGNSITIKSASSDSKEISIFSVIGKRVFTASFSGTKKDINISSINSGIYVLKVTESGKTATKKLVIR